MAYLKSNRFRFGRDGHSHWLWQRISALMLIPLSIWLILNFNGMVFDDYEQSLTWVSTPFVGCLLGLTLVILLFHGHYGVTVVVDDYLRGPWRTIAIRISSLVSIVAGLGVVVAILILVFPR